MFASKVTAKGQVTIPKKVRARLRVQSGDVIAYEFLEDGKVAIHRVEALDAGWHRAIASTLADEWNSAEDEEAFGDL